MTRPEKILIVDDDESWTDFCRVALSAAGFSPDVALSGTEALRRTDKTQYDLVITDLQMPPPGDGRAVTLGVRARWPTTDVVLMTAAPTVESAVTVLKDGACDYFIKPFPADALVANVERVLAARRQRDELALERRLREELSAAYEELKRLDKLKEGFLARVSHELNTPLATAALAVALMGEEVPAESPLRRHVKRAEDAVGRLRAVVEDLLAFMDLQKPDVEVKAEPTPLAPLVAEVLGDVERLAKTKGLTVESRLPDNLPAPPLERALMKKALTHLARNAVYFNRQGGTLTISAKHVQKWVSVSVTDTGEGIPVAEQERVFDAFYQVAEYMTRTVGGLGLGLALVKRIVEAHKGVIRLESTPGKGTTVTLQLPL